MAVPSWCAIDQAPARFLLGDSFGRLSMLSLDNINELGMILIPLGEVWPTLPGCGMEHNKFFADFASDFLDIYDKSGSLPGLTFG